MNTLLDAAKTLAATDLRIAFRRAGLIKKSLGILAVAALVVLTIGATWKYVDSAKEEQAQRQRQEKLSHLARNAQSKVSIASNVESNLPAMGSFGQREERNRKNAVAVAANNAGDLLQVRFSKVMQGLQSALMQDASVTSFEGRVVESRSVSGKLVVEAENEQTLRRSVQRMLSNHQFDSVEMIGMKNSVRGAERFMVAEIVFVMRAN